MKPDVKAEPQRSHRSESYLQQLCRSKSKQRHKKLGWKVSFLKQGSDSPTFLTAQTREANPPPGRPDLRLSLCGANPKQRQAVVVAQCSRHSAGPNVFQKGILLHKWLH